MKSIYEHESLMINSLMKMSPTDPFKTTGRQVPNNNTYYTVACVGDFYSSMNVSDEPLNTTENHLPSNHQPLK